MTLTRFTPKVPSPPLGLACVVAGASLVTHLFGAMPGTLGRLTPAGHDMLFAGVLLWLTRELLHHPGTARRRALLPGAGREG